MKGLLKGLKYIQHIFEDEEEPEMQIGLPTDVKHVAHIGWDGPTTNAPSWMNQYKSDQDSTGPPNDIQLASMMGARDAKPPIAADRRNLLDNESPMGSPSRRRADKSRQSRRQNSAGSGGSSVESPKRSATDSRRLPSSALGPDSSTRGTANVPPKSSRRKKSKNAAGESSRGASRCRNTSMMSDGNPYSDPGAEGEPERGSGLRLKG